MRMGQIKALGGRRARNLGGGDLCQKEDPGHLAAAGVRYLTFDLTDLAIVVCYLTDRPLLFSVWLAFRLLSPTSGLSDFDFTD